MMLLLAAQEGGRGKIRREGKEGRRNCVLAAGKREGKRNFSSSSASVAAKQFPFFMKAINGKTQDAEKKGENNGGEGRVMFVLRW